MLAGIDEYILNSSVLPSGSWDSSVWNQSISKWNQSTEHEQSQRRTSTNLQSSNALPLPENVNEDIDDDPLERTGRIFGGLLRDVKRKLPHLKSDFTDAFNFRCLVALIFVYFSFLAPTITFAAILSHETEGLLGVSEMICSTSICGVIFGLFAGQPLIILGATGPLLIMEESIYHLSKTINVEFLPWRGWIGFWTTILCTLIIALDLSYLVRYFTLFTEEVISALISAVFIHESFRYVWNMLEPLQFGNPSETLGINFPCNTTTIDASGDYNVSVGLMAIVLLFGTCLLCHHILQLRHSQYFPLQLRRLLSDFGIVFSVLIFLLFDILMKDNYSPKLDIPDGFTSTAPEKRGWLVDMMGSKRSLTVAEIIFAIVPAFLVTIILFMETELTGTIVDRKDHKLVKGSGYNLDLLMVGLLVSVCSIFGLPWMCACPVHSIAHLNSLSIFSNNHAPGTRPHVTRVIEQRVTNILIHLMIGLSVFLAPILRTIPIAVLLGVLLYLGVTALSHLHLSLRIKLLFIPPNHHPDLHYIRKVKTRKVHLFTAIQLFCLVIVLAVKNSILAPTFPFFILLMLPLRWLLKHLFTEEELYELDHDSDVTTSDDVDQYDVHVPM